MPERNDFNWFFITKEDWDLIYDIIGETTIEDVVLNQDIRKNFTVRYFLNY